MKAQRVAIGEVVKVNRVGMWLVVGLVMILARAGGSFYYIANETNPEAVAFVGRNDRIGTNASVTDDHIQIETVQSFNKVGQSEADTKSANEANQKCPAPVFSAESLPVQQFTIDGQNECIAQHASKAVGPFGRVTVRVDHVGKLQVQGPTNDKSFQLTEIAVSDTSHWWDGPGKVLAPLVSGLGIALFAGAVMAYRRARRPRPNA